MQVIDIWLLHNAYDENDFRIIVHNLGSQADPVHCRLYNNRSAADHATAEHGENWAGAEFHAPVSAQETIAEVARSVVDTYWVCTDAEYAAATTLCDCTKQGS